MREDEVLAVIESDGTRRRSRPGQMSSLETSAGPEDPPNRRNR